MINGKHVDSYELNEPGLWKRQSGTGGQQLYKLLQQTCARGGSGKCVQTAHTQLYKYGQPLTGIHIHTVLCHALDKLCNNKCTIYQPSLSPFCIVYSSLLNMFQNSTGLTRTSTVHTWCNELNYALKYKQLNARIYKLKKYNAPCS